MTVPTYHARLDATAASIAARVNTLHVAGFELNGNAGKPLFAGGPPVTATNISVAITDPREVAAAKVATTPPAKPSLDGDLADAIAQIRSGDNSPDAGYRRTVVDLAVQKQGAGRAVAIQSAITSQVNDSRESVSGVNIDEEMVNMVAFQHAYEAAARLLTAIDETLDTLINRTALSEGKPMDMRVTPSWLPSGACRTCRGTWPHRHAPRRRCPPGNSSASRPTHRPAYLRCCVCEATSAPPSSSRPTPPTVSAC